MSIDLLALLAGMAELCQPRQFFLGWFDFERQVELGKKAAPIRGSKWGRIGCCNRRLSKPGSRELAVEKDRLFQTGRCRLHRYIVRSFPIATVVLQEEAFYPAV